MQKLAEALIRGYQVVISPILHTLAGPGFGCRFDPSCSAYGLAVVRRFGWAEGTRLAWSRILRCRPGCPGGYDPPPV